MGELQAIMTGLSKLNEQSKNFHSANAGFGLAAYRSGIRENSKAEFQITGFVRRLGADGKTPLISIRANLILNDNSAIPCSGYGIAVLKFLDVVMDDEELSNALIGTGFAEAMQNDGLFDIKVNLPLRCVVQFGKKTTNASKKVVLEIKEVTICRAF